MRKAEAASVETVKRMKGLINWNARQASGFAAACNGADRVGAGGRMTAA
jgi:hypothetical protein